MAGPPLILHFFAVTTLGGSELGALELMRRQTDLRHRLLFLLPPGPASQLYEEAGYETASLDLGRAGWLAVRRRLDRHLDRLRPAIVHAYGLRPSLLVRLRRPRPLLVQAIHSLDLHRPAWQAWLDRLTAGRVDLYIANSRVGARFIAEARGAAARRVEVVENGIDVRPYLDASAQREAARGALGLDASDAAILTVANLRAPKGLDDLVRTATALRDRGRRFVWLVAGTGPDEPWLRQELARARLSPPVRLLGFRRDIPDLLAAADLFCLTSHREGVPVAILEAMASGLAVVATDVGGVAELVVDGETGLVVPPRSPAAACEALERLLDGPEMRQAMGRAGRRRACQRYAIDRAAARIGELYRRLLAGAGRRGA